MKQESLSLEEFQEKFRTEEACKEHLFQMRWPEGYKCPRCGHERYYVHGPRHLYQCKACRYQASLTAGTMLDRARVPLTKWFLAIFVMATVQKGIPISRLGPILGISGYKTLWALSHRIRKAVADNHEKRSREGQSEFDNTLVACLLSGRATFADLTA